MKCLVFNGWAAGPETWALCTFRHDWVFDYIEQLDGMPERVIEDSDEVLLVGFSMGGSMALKMYLKHPEKVKGLVLVSATPCMMEKGDGEMVWRGMSQRRIAALKFGTKMVFGHDPSSLYAEENLDRGLDYLRNTDIREDLLAMSRSSSSQMTSLPVRVIQSERDGIVRPENAIFLKQVFPQAEVVIVEGSEHVLPIKSPGLIDEAVNDIVSKLTK